MAGIAKAQTIKQAKASYRSRGRPSVSEKELRHIQRSIELDARAEKIRENERRRAEAVRQRAEREKNAKSERERCALGSQRRFDRFGFQASQYHLGAFFGKKRNVPVVMEAADRKEEENTEEEEEEECDAGEEEDLFEEEGLDDEVLLSALNETTAEPTNLARDDSTIMPLPPLPGQGKVSERATPWPALLVEEELSSLWGELESSTQIARDLDKPAKQLEEPLPPRKESLSSGWFDDDLTAEDFDELDPPQTISSIPKFQKPRSMPPPSRPVRPETCRPAQLSAKPSTVQKAIRGPFMPASTLYCSPDLGFTSTQLEGFVEDDLQLTQAIPG